MEKDSLNSALTVAIDKNLIKTPVKEMDILDDSDTLFCKSLIAPLEFDSGEGD